MQAAGRGPVASMYLSMQQATELILKQLGLGEFKLRQLHHIHPFLRLHNRVLEAHTAPHG